MRYGWDAKMKAANQGADAPELPGWLAEPTTAWRMLTDASRFPRLGALLDDQAFPIDTFRTNCKLAKECLEMQAGFGRPSAESRKNLWGSRTGPLWLTWAFYAARSYSLRRPPSTGRRLTRTWERSATG